MTHKEWLDNEYKQWVKALQESTVHNFKEHPMVRRMLSLDFKTIEFDYLHLHMDQEMVELIDKIDRIGYFEFYHITDACMRMVHYAANILKHDPHSICEIGGGVGQFYAILRALGYKGHYHILDLPEVQEFQRKYLDEVEKQTGLLLPFCDSYPPHYVVSFYSLGEFDDETKQWYIDNVIKQSLHGFVIFNPHSGASSEINFDCKVEDEYPLTSPGNKICTW